METAFSLYKHSASRINEILNSSDYNYREKDSVPLRDQLTFTNDLRQLLGNVCRHEGLEVTIR